MPRRDKGLPRKCECGGKLVHTRSFGRVWTVCMKCTPVTTVDLNRLKGKKTGFTRKGGTNG